MMTTSVRSGHPYLIFMHLSVRPVLTALLRLQRRPNLPSAWVKEFAPPSMQAMRQSSARPLALFYFSSNSRTGSLFVLPGSPSRKRNTRNFANASVRLHSRALEMGERNLRNVSEQLHYGPLQLIALAQLSLGSLQENPNRLNAEVEVLKKTLHECARQIRHLSIGRVPSQREAMSLGEVIGASVCLRGRVSVTADLQDLPQKVPYVLKSCLYQL